MRRTPNRGEGIVTYFALVNKSGKSTLISEFILGELLNESFFIALSFEVGREDGLCVSVVLALGASLATYRVTLQELVRPKQKGVATRKYR